MIFIFNLFFILFPTQATQVEHKEIAQMCWGAEHPVCYHFVRDDKKKTHFLIEDSMQGQKTKALINKKSILALAHLRQLPQILPRPKGKNREFASALNSDLCPTPIRFQNSPQEKEVVFCYESLAKAERVKYEKWLSALKQYLKD